MYSQTKINTNNKNNWCGFANASVFNKKQIFINMSVLYLSSDWDFKASLQTNILVLHLGTKKITHLITISEHNQYTYTQACVCEVGAM